MTPTEIIGLINTALLTLGSTLIVLWQRKVAIDRETVRVKVETDATALREKLNQDAANLAAGLSTTHRQVVAEAQDTRDLIQSLHERLDKVVPQRNHLAERVEQLEFQLEKSRCQFPRPDGSAGCDPGKPIPRTSRDLE